MIALPAEAGQFGPLSYEEVEGDGIVITECSRDAVGSLSIAGEIGGVPVVAIGKRAFFGYSGLTNICIGEGMRRIGDEPFRPVQAS